MTAAIPEDESLIAGMAVGDTQAAAVLVRRYQRRMYGLALGILGDPGAAEDCAQEAFLRAWIHAGTFDPRRGSAAGWLLTLARNVALVALRAHGRRPSLATDPSVLADLARPASAPEPANAAVASDEARRLHAALAALPEPQRRALVLATWYGATGAEIADVEGIPLGTAKTRLRGGLLRLREALTVGGPR
ncbi:MAG: RNA polymerase sigma factor [Mycobacteriales bacterium]